MIFVIVSLGLIILSLLIVIAGMLKLRLLYLVLIFCCIADISFAQQPERLSYSTTSNYSDSSVVIDTAIGKLPGVYPPSSRDVRKLGMNTALFFGSSLVVFGILSFSPEYVSGWEKSNIEIETLFENWSENVKEGPETDHDIFFFNYVTHPYAGAVYYMTARSCGFKPLECFLYSATMSTLFWEYGVEAFAEVPSTQDVLITPIAGIVAGEIFYVIKKNIMNHDKRVLGSKLLGSMTLLFLDPFNTVLDCAGYKQKVKKELSFSPALLNDGTTKTYLQLNFAVHF